MTLAASEVRLLKAARKVFETGESVINQRFPPERLTESHEISLSLAMEEAEKYFQGSYAAYRVAKERLWRKFDAATKRRGFWAVIFLHELGYRVEVYRQTSFGGGVIEPGNVSQETFNNWCVLANLAYIDRILETGEIK